jgi:hypothetical protein
MKAIEIVKEYLKGTCQYSNTMEGGGSRLYGCIHIRVKDARFNSYYPNEPCTTDDWKACPLNTAEPPEAS